MRLRELLDGSKHRHLPIAKLAEKLHVTDTTIKRYLDNHWTTVDRGVLERFADLVGCKISEIFATHSSPFWDAFSGPASICNYVRPEYQGSFLDEKARSVINRLVTDCAKHTKVDDISADERTQFLKVAKNNCVVVGSPRRNQASEHALAQTFRPSRSDPPPFQFLWNPSMNLKPGTSIFSSVAATTTSPCGILFGSRDPKQLVAATYFSEPKEFIDLSTEDGRDCAIVSVINHSTGPAPARKLIVLAGFTEIGTMAAAEMLASDFREMEPRDKDTYVWGIVEVIYSKEAGEKDREILHKDWRYRSGGRSPIPFKEEPIKKAGGARRH